MEVDQHDRVAATGKSLCVPAVRPVISEVALRSAVNQKSDRVLPARLKAVRLDDVAVNGLVIPALEVELLELAQAAPAQQLLVGPGQAVRCTAAHRHGKQVRRCAEVFPRKHN